jgi:excisionase family DNA binding protein
MSTQTNENYISIEEAAKYLGVKSSTIRTWIKVKELPAHKIGGKLWKFKRSEIDEWVKSSNGTT